jgi:hypothetical protein
MQKIEIDLREPFEHNLERALALPEAHDRANAPDEEVAAALRRIYELAYGRSVETPIGLVAIAPALAPALAEARLSVASRQGLLAAIRDKLASPSRALRDEDRSKRPHFTANAAVEAPELRENCRARRPRTGFEFAGLRA